MATNTKIELLSLSSDVREWFERFDFFIIAQNLRVVVAEDAAAPEIEQARVKHLANFISKVDGSVYKLIKSLCRPDTVESRSYEEVKQLIIEHISPRPTKFAQRYKFHKLVQREGQAASDFISELKSTGAECEYTNFNEALLDRLLVGLRDEKLVFELLVKENLTLDIAIKEVLGREQARKEAHLMNSVGNEAVNKVSYQKSVGSRFQSESKGAGRGGQKKGSSGSKPFNHGVKCDRCRLLGHTGDQCNTKCFSCGQMYHVKNQCWKNKSKGKMGNGCHQVGECEGTSEEYEEDLSNLSNILPDAMFHVDDYSFGQYENFRDCANINTHDLFVSHLCKSKTECENFPRYNSKLISDDLMKDNIISYDSKVNDDKLNNPMCDFLECNNTDLPGIVVDYPKFTVDRKLSDDILKLSSSSKPLVNCLVNGISLDFEFDIGSSLTVVSHNTLLGVGLNTNLFPSSRTLVVANGMNQPVKGYSVVDVELNHKHVKDLHLYVVDGYFPSLLGRSWI